jgi:hypothetical protein
VQQTSRQPTARLASIPGVEKKPLKWDLSVFIHLLQQVFKMEGRLRCGLDHAVLCLEDENAVKSIYGSRNQGKFWFVP